MQLTQVEDTFRISKSDLGICPIYHHRPHRTQAHILVCFLALVMWRTLHRTGTMLMLNSNSTISSMGTGIAAEGL